MRWIKYGLLIFFLAYAGFSQDFKIPIDDFFSAVKNGDQKKVKQFLDKGFDIYLKDKDGFQAVHYAIAQKNIKITKLLLINELQRMINNGGDFLGYTKTILNLIDYVKEDTILKKIYYTGKSIRNKDPIDFYALFIGELPIRESEQIELLYPSVDDKKDIQLSTLNTPEIESQPYPDMLVGKLYNIPLLSKFVPENFYYFYAKSLDKTLEMLDYINEKKILFNKRYNAFFITHHLKEKTLTQLAINDNKEARALYASVIKEMVLTGSDFFLRNGTDISLIFKLKNKSKFQSEMLSQRNDFEKLYETNKEEFDLDNYKLKYIYTLDGKINSYYCDIGDDTVIITNSLQALKKIIAVLEYKEKSLAETDDFKYMQFLLYEKEIENGNDCILYFSDSFIRYLISPELRIKEARRSIEAVRLAILEKLSIFYYQLTENNAKTITDLLEKTILDPINKKNKEILTNNLKDYSLSENGLTVISPKFGRSGYFKPNIEQDLGLVSKEEANQYNNFVKEYNSFWKSFFSPIGIRISLKNDRFHLTLHVLPFMHLSSYNSLLEWVLGNPVTINSKNILKEEIFNLFFKLTPLIKKQLEKIIDRDSPLSEIISYLGNYTAIYFLDTHPMLDFNINTLFSALFLANEPAKLQSSLLSFLAWSLLHPLRITIPLVENINKEKFIKLFDLFFSQIPDIYKSDKFSFDYYKTSYHGKTIRVLKINFLEMFTLRLYTYIDREIYITTTEDYIKRNIESLENIDYYITPINLDNSVLLRLNPNSIQSEKNKIIANFIENFKKTNTRNLVTLQLLNNIFPNSPNLLQKMYDTYAFEIACPANGDFRYNTFNNQFENSLFGSLLNPLIDSEKIKKQIEDSFFEIKNLELSLEFSAKGIKTQIIIK